MKYLTWLALLTSCSPVFAGGPITQVQRTYSTASGTTLTTAWGTLVSSLSKEANYVDIYQTSTAGTIILGIGAVGHEYNALYIPASTARTIPLRIPKNSRVSVKALNATVGAGETIFNFME